MNLEHADSAGAFEPVTSNNLTLGFVEPFVSADGSLNRYIHYNAGVREEVVRIDNEDLLTPDNSFDKTTSLALPKATLTRRFTTGRGQLWRSFSYRRPAHRQRSGYNRHVIPACAVARLAASRFETVSSIPG